MFGRSKFAGTRGHANQQIGTSCEDSDARRIATADHVKRKPGPHYGQAVDLPTIADHFGYGRKRGQLIAVVELQVVPDVVIGVAVFVVKIEIVLDYSARRSVRNSALIERVRPAVLCVKREPVAEALAETQLRAL